MVMRVSKDRIDMDDKVLQKPVLKDYGESVVTANSSTSYTINLTLGNVFDITLTGNCAFTFSNPSASGTACTFTLLLRQDSTGSRTVTWPAAVSWLGGSEPVLYTSGEHLFTFTTINGGTTWFGVLAGGYETIEYNFDSTVEGFTGTNTSVSASGGSLIINSPTTADPIVRTPTISLDGSVYRKIHIRIKRTAGSAWDGSIYYTTGGHGESASYRFLNAQPSWDGNFQIITADANNLYAGADDWITSTITQVRFDFGASTSDTFEVDYIKFIAG